MFVFLLLRHNENEYFSGLSFSKPWYVVDHRNDVKEYL